MPNGPTFSYAYAPRITIRLDRVSHTAVLRIFQSRSKGMERYTSVSEYIQGLTDRLTDRPELLIEIVNDRSTIIMCPKDEDTERILTVVLLAPSTEHLIAIQKLSHANGVAVRVQRHISHLARPCNTRSIRTYCCVGTVTHTACR